MVTIFFKHEFIRRVVGRILTENATHIVVFSDTDQVEYNLPKACIQRIHAC